MKILWLSHLIPYPPQGGGVFQRSANLLKAVAGDHQVSLLAFNQKNLLRIVNNNADYALRVAIDEIKKICKSVDVIDIECESHAYGKQLLAFSSLFSPLPYSVRWLTSEVYSKTLKTILLSNKFDVVWFDTISLAQYLDKSEMGSALTILNHHNIESDMMLRRANVERNYIKMAYFLQEAKKLKRYEMREIGQFDINVTCSGLDSQRLETISPGIKTSVVPNGVDTDFFYPNNNIIPDPYTLIFIGGMGWYPNRDAMLFFANKVWPLLKKKIPKVNMHVVGEHPPQELVQLGSRDARYHVHGFVNDIKEIFNNAGIYVCPISDGGGTKLKILDALAMGKAIVANPIACEGIDVVNGKHVLFAVTPDEYVDAIEKLISTPSLMKSLSEDSRKLILNKYSYQIIGRNLLELIRQ